MSEYLFVYGTLLPQFAHGEIQSVVRQLKFVGDGFAPGRLYDLGDYPGAVIDDSGDAKIIGQVFRLPEDAMLRANLLAQLDAYEGYRPPDGSPSLFVRKRMPVTLSSGAKVDCWIYVYNRDTSQARLIGGGDYAERDRAGESA